MKLYHERVTTNTVLIYMIVTKLQRSQTCKFSNIVHLNKVVLWALAGMPQGCAHYFSGMKGGKLKAHILQNNVA